MLHLDQVSVAFDGVPVLDDVTLDRADGDVLAVLGPSGSGKSSLLRAIAGLEPLAAGRISFDGEDLAGVPTHRRGFALMFQDGQLFGHLDVARNVGYALRLRRRPAAEIRWRVADLLELVGLTGYADRLPGTLSGGEQQRVALARALAVEPRLLLLDEPLSALDAALRQRLATDLREILRAAGTTALLVTHDHEEAFAVASRLAVLRAGQLVQHGAIGEVWQRPADADTALFLGYARVLEGAAADVVRRLVGWTVDHAPAVAVRRSAFVVSTSSTSSAAGDGSSGGTGSTGGVVRSAVVAPEQLRLVVELDGVGEVAAVAPLGSHVSVGERVAVRLDASRMAPVGSAHR